MLRGRCLKRNKSLLSLVNNCVKKSEHNGSVTSGLFNIAETVQNSDFPNGNERESCAELIHIVCTYVKYSVKAFNLINELTDRIRMVRFSKHVQFRDAKRLAFAYHQLSLSKERLWAANLFLTSMNLQTDLVPLKTMNTIILGSANECKSDVLSLVEKCVDHFITNIEMYVPSDHLDFFIVIQSGMKVLSCDSIISSYHLRCLIGFHDVSGISFLFSLEEIPKLIYQYCSFSGKYIQPIKSHLVPLLCRLSFYLLRSPKVALNMLCIVIRALNFNKNLCTVKLLRPISHNCLEKISELLKKDPTQFIPGKSLTQSLHSVVVSSSIAGSDLKEIPVFENVKGPYEFQTPTSSPLDCSNHVINFIQIDEVDTSSLLLLLQTSRRLGINNKHCEVVKRILILKDEELSKRELLNIICELGHSVRSCIKETADQELLAKRCIYVLQSKYGRDIGIDIRIMNFLSKSKILIEGLMKTSLPSNTTPINFINYLLNTLDSCRINKNIEVTLPLLDQFLSTSVTDGLDDTTVAMAYLRIEAVIGGFKNNIEFKKKCSEVLSHCVSCFRLNKVSLRYVHIMISRCKNYPSIYVDCSGSRVHNYEGLLILKFQSAVQNKTNFDDETLLSCLLMLLSKTVKYESSGSEKHALWILPSVLRKSGSELNNIHLIKTLQTIAHEKNYIQDVWSCNKLCSLAIGKLEYEIKIGIRNDKSVLSAAEAADLITALGTLSVGKNLIPDLNTIINKNPSAVPAIAVAGICKAYANFRYAGGGGASAAIANEKNLSIRDLVVSLKYSSITQCANSLLWESLGSQVIIKLSKASWSHLTQLVTAITASSLYHPPLNRAILNRLEQLENVSNFTILNYVEDVRRRDISVQKRKIQILQKKSHRSRR